MMMMIPLPIQGEYKLWLYRNYIVSLFCFHLSVDSVTTNDITILLLIILRDGSRSATCAVLYYPGMCCPSISYISKQAKLSALSCISVLSDKARPSLFTVYHRIFQKAMQAGGHFFIFHSTADCTIRAK